MDKIKYGDMELLPPKSDLVFKAVFGTEDSKDILAAFLRDALGLEIESGDDLEFLNNEMSVDYQADKLMRLDLRVKTVDNCYVNVEIQLLNRRDIIERGIIYNAKNLISQVTKGMRYKDIGRTISLIIVDFTLFDEIEAWYNEYIFKNRENNAILSELTQICFLELPKALNQSVNPKELTPIAQWALFLSAADEEVLNMVSSENTDIKKAVKKLIYVSEDEKLRFACEMREKAEMDYYSDLAYAKDDGIEIGIQRGLERGIQRGLEQGIKQGIQQGVERGEAKKQAEIAAQLKSEGVSIELISKCTGLTLEQIKEL